MTQTATGLRGKLEDMTRTVDFGGGLRGMTDDDREILCLECGTGAATGFEPAAGWHFLGVYTGDGWEFHDFCSLVCLRKWIDGQFDDLVVRMPSNREYTIHATVVRLETAKPHMIVEAAS